MSVLRIVKYIFIPLLLVSTAHAEKLKNVHLPLFDIMPGMKAVWVAEKMIYNGQPMSIQNYKSNRRAKDVMRFFESRWKIKGFGELKYQTLGKDLTVGISRNGYTYSVQAHNIPGGSEGALVVTRDKGFVQTKTKFPLLPDAHIVSRIHNLDMGIKSETLTVSTYRSAVSNKQWYQSNLPRTGWIGQRSMQNSGGDTLEFQKGKQICQLRFVNKSPVREHRSMVMIHWIKG